MTPNTYTLFVVPALAAAVVGEFQHLVPTVVAGIGIGMIQAWLIFLSGKYSWMPQSGRGRDGAPRRDAHRAARDRPGGPRTRRRCCARTSVGRRVRGRSRCRSSRASSSAPSRCVVTSGSSRVRGDHHVHLRGPRPVARRGHRVRRPGVTRPAGTRRRRRLHAELPDRRLGRAVPDRSAPRRDSPRRSSASSSASQPSACAA